MSSAENVWQTINPLTAITSGTYPSHTGKTMPEKTNTFLAGVRDSTPILIGITPFGLICGAVCLSTGMPEWAAVGFSTIIFAGASQLVANQLMADHASTLVVILTGLVINLRMFMYSASLAPHLKGLSPLKKGALAYLLTDQAYALSIARFGRGDGEAITKPLYYFGSGVTIWAVFVLTTAVGAFVGARIPASLDLGFAIPLTFIAVVVPAIKDRPAALAAAAAGLVALLADPLPYNLGLMVGAVCGILTGWLVERRSARG